MLSRVANSLYWIARYVERVENTSRLLEVNLQLLGDFEAYVEGNEEKFWLAAISSSGLKDLFFENYDKLDAESVTSFLAFDADNPSSILSSIISARENARMIRDQISHEMWESINNIYHTVKADGKNDFGESLPYGFFTEIKNFSHQFFGLVDSTFFHRDGFRFIQIGKFLERADQTTRMIDLKHFLPIESENEEGGTVDVAGWVAVLRSCCAVDAFQSEHLGEIESLKISEFLLLSNTFPRSVSFCLNSLAYHLRALTGTSEGQYSNSVEKLVGKIKSDLSYRSIEDIMGIGLHEYVDIVQQDIISINNDLFKIYFEVPSMNMEAEIEVQKAVQNQFQQ